MSFFVHSPLSLGERGVRGVRARYVAAAAAVDNSAGASAPEHLVERVVRYLGTQGFDNIQELEIMPENVRFGLPPEIVEAIGAAPALAE